MALRIVAFGDSRSPHRDYEEAIRNSWGIEQEVEAVTIAWIKSCTSSFLSSDNLFCRVSPSVSQDTIINAIFTAGRRIERAVREGWDADCYIADIETQLENLGA
jgi:hypothetical protein